MTNKTTNDMMKRFFSLSLMIILAVGAWADDDFGTDKTISTTMLWTFESYAVDAEIAGGTTIDINGLYVKADDSKKTTVKSMGNTTSFDLGGESVTPTKYMDVQNGRAVTNPTKASAISTYLCGFNAAVAGMVYVCIAGNETTDTKTYTAYIGLNGNTEGSIVNTTGRRVAGLTVLSRTSTTPGVITIGSSGSHWIAAIRFVPETVTTPSISQTDNSVTISAGTSSISGTTLKTYYTTDGSTPSATNGTEYTGAISLTKSCTIKAITVSSGGASSSVVSQECTYTAPAKTDISEATVNLSNTSFTYTGSEQAPTVSSVILGGNALTLNTDYTVNAISSQTNVGTGYTVTVTGTGSYEGTASATWSITQATNTLSGTLSIEGWTYGSTANSPSGVTAAFGTVGYKYSSASDGEYGTYDAIVNGTVGTWWVKAYVDGTDNYTYVESDAVSFTISAATQTATITAETNQSTTYNGQAQPLTASVDHGTLLITYYTNEGHTEGETTETPINAGTYYAIVSQSDANYTSDPVNVTFTINKADYTVTGTATATAEAGTQVKDIAISGLTVKDVSNTEVSGTWAFSSTDTPAEGNTTAYEATFTPTTADGNYNTLSQNIVPTITAANIFGTEEVVSTEKTWTFRDYEDGDKTAFSEKDGLYSRAISARYYTISSLESPKLLSFSDGFVVNINKVAVTNSGLSYSTSGDNPAYITTANSRPNNTNNGTQLFAFNASVAGTVYVLMEAVATLSYRPRIYFYKSGDPGMQQVVNNSNTTDTEIHEFSYTSTDTEAGSFFIGSANQACKIYAIRFVPKGTSMEDKATMNLNTTTGGTVSVKVGDTETDYRTFDKNTNVTLTATAANEYYAFTKWTIGDAESTENPLTLEMDADKTVTAVFTSTETITQPSIAFDVNGVVTITPGESSLEGATIKTYYTIDNTVPTESSLLYDSSNKPEVIPNTTVRAISINDVTKVVSTEADAQTYTYDTSTLQKISGTTTWTFDKFAKDQQLSNTYVYGYKGLYVKGHSESNYAVVKSASASATIEGTEIAVGKYLYIPGGNTTSTTGKAANELTADRVAFCTTVPGTVYVYMAGRYNNTHDFIIDVNGTQNKTAVPAKTDNKETVTLVSQDIPVIPEGGANVFIGTSTSACDIYIVKFVAKETYTLTATVSPEEKGEIEVKYNGKDEATTDRTFVSGANIILTAKNNVSGYTFKNWTGTDAPAGEDANNASVSLTMNADKTLTANFEVVNHTLSVSYDNTGGTVTMNGGTEALAADYNESVGEGSVTLTATPASGYQFVEWTDNDNNRLSTLNTYTFDLTADTQVKAVFKQPTSPATAITTETTWTFDGLTAGTNLSGTQVYELDGLYISGHNPNGSNPAKVVAGTSTTDTQIAGEVTNYVQFDGGSTSSLASKEVTDYATDKAAFKVGTSGTVSVFTGAATDRKIIIEVNGATKQNQYSDLALGLQTRDVTETSNVFIGTTTGAGYIYAIKFTPEMVTAPQINVDNQVGTIAEGTSNLTETANKVIKTYYTIDGTEPTAESTLYEGVIMASGENITVKAISINTITGTKSEVTTATGLTLQLPVVTFSATATNGTVAWKKAGTTDAQADNYEKGTTIEVTAIPADGYMFQSWTKGDEVVAKTPTYTFTLMENTALVAHFKSIGNTVPVILVAGQSNTDGRIDASELPASFTGLAHCLWSYANAKTSPAGTFNNKVWEIGDFVNYTPTSDTGTQWAYDAVVYDKIGKNLGSDFYVIKQSKGNTGISPASGGCGLFWSANPLWMSRTASANEGGLSLLKALTDHIDASLAKIPSGKEADIKFLMWHQGEGDGNGKQGPVYYQQMKAIINYVRNHLAQKDAKYSNLPFVLGGITSISKQYNAEVEAAKQQLANEDANVYYVSADGITADGLKSDVLHFNAEGGQTFGERVWQTIYENNLLLGLEDGTGSATAVATGLEEVDPISETTEWTFTNLTAGTIYSEKTNLNGLYLQAQSDQTITVQDDNSLRVPAADRSDITIYGLTAGDALGTYHIVGVNTAVPGTFTATVAPDTEPTDAQAERNMSLVFNGEKVDTKNVRTVWNGSEDHKTTLTFQSDKTGTFYLTSAHAYRIYNVTFTPTTLYTLTVNQPEEGGAIQINNADAVTSSYAKGTEIILTAVPAVGYEFSYWTVDGVQDTEHTTNTLTLTMNAAHTVSASFNPVPLVPSVAWKENTADGKAVYTITSSDDNNIKYQLGDEAAVDVQGKTVDVEVSEKTTLKAWSYNDAKESTKLEVTLMATPIVESNGTFDFLAVKGAMDANVNVELESDAAAYASDGTALYKTSIETAATFAGKMAFSELAAAGNIYLRNDKGFLSVKQSQGTLYVAILGAEAGKSLTITVDAANATASTHTGTITFGQPYEIEAEDLINGNLVIKLTDFTGTLNIRSIAITDLKLTAPTIAVKGLSEDKTKSVYTISYNSKDVLHYKLDADGTEETPSPTTAGRYDVEISVNGTLTAWTTREGATLSDVTTRSVYVPTDSVYADGVYDFTKVKGTTPVEIVTSEQTVGGQTVYAPNAITAATLDRRFAFSSITGTDVRLMGGTGMRVAKGKNVYIALKNLEKDKVLAINYTTTSGDDGIKFKSVSILDGATVDANVVSGQEYTINEAGNILLQVSNANASLDISSIKLGSKMKTEQADVEYVVTNDEATVTGFTTAETASEITVPAYVDGAPVTAIAEGTFTEENTANVTSIDLSETAVTFDSGTTRETVDELKNINSATLIYLPSTANVTGTNVVTKTGTGTDATYTCDDYQIMDGKASSVPHAFTAAAAKIIRTFTSGVKCTVCLPYQFTASGGSFYQFTGISDGMVEMTEQTGTLDANTPYIFVPSSDATKGASASNVTVSISDAPETVDAANHFTFKGTFEKTIWDEATAEGIYGFAANAQDGAEVGQFVRVGAGASIDAYRAYLKYEGEGTLIGPSSAPRRAPIVLPNTLSIKWIPVQSGATTIRNIEVNGDGDAPAYNLSGQRVGKDYKGIVIVNGKKVRK